MSDDVIVIERIVNSGCLDSSKTIVNIKILPLPEIWGESFNIRLQITPNSGLRISSYFDPPILGVSYSSFIPMARQIQAWVMRFHDNSIPATEEILKNAFF